MQMTNKVAWAIVVGVEVVKGSIMDLIWNWSSQGESLMNGDEYFCM